MRFGGLSTSSWKITFAINQEDLRACRENGLKTNYFRLYSRYFRKFLEFIPGKEYCPKPHNQEKKTIKGETRLLM
jgi:hypothetical protein